MQDKTYNIQFSQRLRELMVLRGFSSRAATSGVSPSALCKEVGCHTEMALRYLDGRSIPSPEVIVKLAKWLDVEPSFLLFGEESNISSKDSGIIKLDKDFFKYALSKLVTIIEDIENKSDFTDYFVNLLHDLSQIRGVSTDQIKNILDLALKSVSLIKNERGIGNMDHEMQRKVTSKIAS